MHLLASTKIATAALFALARFGESKRHPGGVDGIFVQRVLNDEATASRKGPSLGSELSNIGRDFLMNQHRRFGAVDESTNSYSSTSQQACDASFLSCLQDDKCVLCFLSLQTEGIDWASVTPETPCPDVTQILFDAGHCSEMKTSVQSIDTFCNTFDSCVIWDDNQESGGGSSSLDCDALTSCEWDGMHQSFVGDGICHDGIDCYNHEICDFDGGDCCEDTCKGDSNFFYVECGVEGYACRDSESENCDPSLTTSCKKKGGDSPPQPECGTDETLYRLVMYDSFGDGWDGTKLVLTAKDDESKVLVTGNLKDGAEGTEYVCLSTAPACYHVEVSGGVWGNEVSWEFKPLMKGSPAVADGGSPMDCEFSVGGEVCMRTCDGKPNQDSNNDPEYKTYKQMFSCMSEKCIIQMETCKTEDSCAQCLKDNAPEYCFANDNFNAVIDCGLCHCMDGEEASEYCQDKRAPGSVVPDEKEDDVPKSCSASETLKGSAAVMAFSKCSNFEQIGMMVTEFDANNFGALDAFESCSHSFKNESMHGGRTALGCMQILANAMTDPSSGTNNPDAPLDAIKSLAESIYHNAEDFCDCAKKSSEDCPLCPSFVHFKTLLFETLDACQALDEIDCDAWSEFYTPCKSNIEQMFSGTVDFSNPAQCDYIQNTCGGAGPFPAFRKLDCGREIAKEAWDFYTTYERSCLHSGDDKQSPNPTPKPGPVPSSPTGSPVPVHPKDNATPSEPKPYVPSGDSKFNPSPTKPYKPEKDKTKKKRHILRNLIIVLSLAGAAYWYYKKQSGSFDFVHYRRARNYASDNEMYSSLAMDSGSSSFEPPSLPPTPLTVGGDMT